MDVDDESDGERLEDLATADTDMEGVSVIDVGGDDYEALPIG